MRKYTVLWKLSSRQLQVLALVHADMTNAQIGERLHCSPQTVAAHLKAVFIKLKVRTRAGAAVLYERHRERGNQIGLV